MFRNSGVLPKRTLFSRRSPRAKCLIPIDKKAFILQKYFSFIVFCQ